MSSLVLLGASGLAREVIAMERMLRRYDDVLVLDDAPDLWGTRLDGVEVVGPIEVVAEQVEGDLLLCTGSGAARRRIARRLRGLGVTPERYGRVIHPSVEIPPGCCVGAGCILMAGVVLTARVDVHRHVVAMPHVVLTHEDVVADYATLCAGVALGGGVVVEEAAYLGMNASVRQGVTVGRDATLGMGAVLLEDLPAGQTWAGVPARRIATREALVS